MGEAKRRRDVDLPPIDSPPFAICVIFDKDENFTHEDIERGASMALEVFDTYPDTPLFLTVNGYDDDPREVQDIAETREAFCIAAAYIAKHRPEAFLRLDPKIIPVIYNCLVISLNQDKKTYGNTLLIVAHVMDLTAERKMDVVFVEIPKPVSHSDEEHCALVNAFIDMANKLNAAKFHIDFVSSAILAASASYCAFNATKDNSTKLSKEKIETLANQFAVRLRDRLQ